MVHRVGQSCSQPSRRPPYPYGRRRASVTRLGRVRPKHSTAQMKWPSATGETRPANHRTTPVRPTEQAKRRTNTSTPVAGDAAARHTARQPAASARPAALRHFQFSLPAAAPPSFPGLASPPLVSRTKGPGAGCRLDLSLILAGAAAAAASMATGAVTPPPLAGARCVPRGRGFLHRRIAASPM